MCARCARPASKLARAVFVGIAADCKFHQSDIRYQVSNTRARARELRFNITCIYVRPDTISHNCLALHLAASNSRRGKLDLSGKTNRRISPSNLTYSSFRNISAAVKLWITRIRNKGSNVNNKKTVKKKIHLAESPTLTH